MAIKLQLLCFLVSLSSVFANTLNHTRINLNELLDIWDPYRLLDDWDLNRNGSNAGRLSVLCENDLKKYFTGLDEGREWALKLVDASGRYRSGLFSGNGFWIGSKELCNDLNDVTSYNMPFRVAFFVAILRINMTTSEISGTHEITLGLCLPRVCTEDDVKTTIRVSTYRNSSRTIDLRQVRFLSQSYSYLKDTTFYILSCVSVIVFSLMVTASIYDFKRNKMLKKKEENLISEENLMANNNGKNSKELWDDISKIKLNVFSLRSNTTSSELSECRGNHFTNNIQALPEPELQCLRSIENCRIQHITKEDDGDMNTSSILLQPESIALRILLAFSVPANLNKIFNLDNGDNNLSPIHGIRFFSLLWVIFVHICLIIFQLSDNKTFRSKAEKDFLYQTVSNGAYSVDTFFFISGLLVSFIYFRKISAYNETNDNAQLGCFKSQLYQFCNMIVYRFFRLTPPYLFVIGVIEVSMKWFKDHGVMELPTNDYINCPKYWWRNMLYINTLFSARERCMSWSWYLSNDAQFYAIGIIILIITVKRFWLGVTAVGVLLVGAWSTTAFITVDTEHTPSIQEPFANYEEIYDKPWTRIGPYLVGMCVGWILYKTKCKIQMHKGIVGLGWLLSMSCTSSIVYGLYYIQLTPAMSAAYVSLSHTAWAVCMAWVLIACCSGHGGIVNSILSWRYLYPFSRLTYCAYLVHPVLMRSMVLNSDSSVHITRDIVIVLFCGFVVAAYAIALIISLAFEAPVVALLKMAHPIRRKIQLN